MGREKNRKIGSIEFIYFTFHICSIVFFFLSNLSYILHSLSTLIISVNFDFMPSVLTRRDYYVSLTCDFWSDSISSKLKEKTNVETESNMYDQFEKKKNL